ncbi:hypothetical protein OPV22_023413 [Ensete ventricosum]|uniref:Ectonucleotide pyrophosphatase/phosphodiesterase family member 3 n=1 Tax=Ensete ventricosum TaxID=4639 RepID=A0AAV8PF77_ENSVE|nr:hypothetical protein OPV22_023413 [Ensete ventricosum]
MRTRTEGSDGATSTTPFVFLESVSSCGRRERERESERELDLGNPKSIFTSPAFALSLTAVCYQCTSVTCASRDESVHVVMLATCRYNGKKTSQDPQCTTEVQPLSAASHDLQGDHQNSLVVEAPKVDSGSVSIASSNTRKVSREDIELVQNLIERCLQLYMNRGEVVRTLSNRARIEPGFTTLVWQKLEEENSEFFRAYYIRLKLKKQIILFNHLLEHQYHLMKYPIQPKVPLAPIQNGIHPVPVSLPMGYPILPQHLISDPMGCGLSSCHVVNGIPAPGSFHPIRMNSGTNGTTEVAHTAPPAISPMSEMAVSPASAASSNHFPFSSEISGIGLDVTALDTSFPPDVANSGGLQLGSDGVGSSRDSIRSSGQLWNFSLSDLTADLTNLGDLGVLGDYDGSPFLPSDSDILLDSPEPDDIVEEYFADVATGSCPHQSDEEKS